LKTITHIIAKYVAFLWAVLKPLGAWGVFAIAGVDASLFGMPLDAIVAAYVYQNPSRFLLYAFMASAGSTIGSIVIYVIGYEGGEVFLRKRMSPERFEKIHRSFDEHPFWALMFPAMLPPPTPFKLFVLGAAVSEMQFSHFLLAIFSGRMVRFLVLSLLTLKFGPQIVEIFGTVFKQHWKSVLVALAVGLVVWLVMRRKGKTKSLTAEIAENAEKK
jgi:membrane protein YqaA with SNARE-associated domain